MSISKSQYSIVCKYYQSIYNKNVFIVNGYNEKHPNEFIAESYDICEKLNKLKLKYQLKNPKRVHFSVKTKSYFISFSLDKKLQDSIIIKNLEKYNYYKIKFEVFLYKDYLCLRIIEIDPLPNKTNNEIIKIEL